MKETDWDKRAKDYNKLHWANEPTYLETFVKFSNFSKTDRVLDVGTGTGIIAHTIAPKVKEVIGLDISQKMLEHSNWDTNKYFIKQDIRERFFADGVFDKVTARMVFHHIRDGLHEAMGNCYNMLRKGGVMIIGEGIPPVPELEQDFINIFKYKEKRITFSVNDLVWLMKRSGFKHIEYEYYTIKDLSVKKWLNNSDTTEKNKKIIMKLHRNGSKLFKQKYNLRESKDDCVIDILHVIVKGTKRWKKRIYV